MIHFCSIGFKDKAVFLNKHAILFVSNEYDMKEIVLQCTIAYDAQSLRTL